MERNHLALLCFYLQRSPTTITLVICVNHKEIDLKCIVYALAHISL